MLLFVGIYMFTKNSCFCPFIPSPSQDIGSHCREINHKIVGIMDELIGKMIEKVITFHCHIREREGGGGYLVLTYSIMHNIIMNFSC